MTARQRHATIVPLGDMNEIEDDGEQTEGDARRRRRKEKRAKTVKAHRFRNVGGATVTYSLVWNKHLMHSARYAASIFSLVCLILTAIFIFYWIIGIIPSFPTTLATYAVVFFFFFVPVYIIGSAIWVSMAIEFYTLSCVLQVLALAAETYLFVALLYKWITCFDGSAPAYCVDPYIMDTIVTIQLFALWVSALIATCAHVTIIFRGAPAQSVSKMYQLA